TGTGRTVDQAQPAGTPAGVIVQSTAWVAFAPDGKTLATIDDCGSFYSPTACAEVRLWRAATGRQVGKPLIIRVNYYCAEFTRDGTLLVAGSGSEDGFGPIQVWDVTAGKQAGRPLAAGFGPVTWSALSPDGKTLALGADGGAAQ